MGLGRAPCCEKVGLNKGAWTPEEDLRLITYIRKHGHDNWRALPKQAGLLRCGKSCRLRWINYLRPDLRRGNFSKEEENTIIKLHGLLGNKWSKIASCLPGRTDNEIKNVWNTHLKKRLKLEEQPSSSPTPENDGATKRKGSPSSPSPATTSAADDFKCDGHQCKKRYVDAEVLALDNLDIPILPGLSLWNMLDSSAQSPSYHPLPSAETSAWSDNSINDSIDEILGSDIDPEIWNDVVTSTTSTASSESWAEEKQRWLAYLEEELGLLDDKMA